jgi:hypothetical protein
VTTSREMETILVARNRAGAILGISSGSLQRVAPDDNRDMVITFIRVYRNMVNLLGGEYNARTWLHGFNRAFGMTPLQRMSAQGGLAEVCSYLEAHKNI